MTNAQEVETRIGMIKMTTGKPAASKIEKPSATEQQSEFIGLPFAFSSESMSTAIGVAGLLKSAGQQQASLLGIAAGSLNHSYVGFFAANSYQIPALGEQWLFSAELYGADLPEGTYFLDDEIISPFHAGANQSKEETQIVTHGKERTARLYAKYIVPIAAGKHGAVATLAGKQAIKSMVNPVLSGVTSITLEPFYEARDLGEYNYLQRAQRATGLNIGIRWDNRDSANATLAGNVIAFDFTHGAKTDHLPQWSMWQMQYAHFVQLPKVSELNNHVLAFSAQLSDTPSWNEKTDDIYHRPPEFAGVTLGGFRNLRGYSSQRFHGRSAVVYAAEYRVQPSWQPLENIFEGYYNVPWWQWVLFAEAGRVADDFSLSTLHSEMKFSLGVGARFEVEGIVVRTELAKGEEGSQFWVMVNQPF